MPSSPGYKRDYKTEWANAKARGEGDDNAMRHRARYAMEKEGRVERGDGKDVGHVKAVSKGGSNSRENLSVQARSENRSFARNKDGSMKSEKSKRENK